MTIAFRIALSAVALALLLASSVSGRTRPLTADINADHSIDVRDVQVVGTALFHAESTSFAADVNGDGTVDILDFQQVVHEAAVSGKSTPSPTPVSPTQIPAPAAHAHEILALRAVAIAPCAPHATASDNCHRGAHPTHAGHAQRLAHLGLAAHAPPIA